MRKIFAAFSSVFKALRASPHTQRTAAAEFPQRLFCDSVLGNAQITVQKLMGLALQQALVQSKDHGVLVGLFDLHVDVGIIQTLGAGLPGPGTGADRRQAMTSTKS